MWVHINNLNCNYQIMVALLLLVLGCFKFFLTRKWAEGNWADS